MWGVFGGVCGVGVCVGVEWKRSLCCESCRGVGVGWGLGLECAGVEV